MTINKNTIEIFIALMIVFGLAVQDMAYVMAGALTMILIEISGE